MAEYICREKAIEVIQPRVKPSTIYGEGYLQAIEHATEILKLIPAADVQPVKHGEWKFYKNNGIYDTYKCSICKESFELPMDADISQEIRYCPNCGARMDGDAE